MANRNARIACDDALHFVGGKRGAGAANDNDRRDEGPQLARHGEGDGTGDETDSAKPLQFVRRLQRQNQPARLVVNSPVPPLPSRLWEQLVMAAGVDRETRWAALSRAARHTLVQQLIRTEFQVTGKSLNKDEFVTCGGVRLGEVNFKTMESRICPGLYFGGELLDLDGITGGFNFQAAWTTGWIAGQAMAACVRRELGGVHAPAI